jgi:hypothetical protein
MANMEQLYTALRNADAAGDVEGARKLAAYIKAQQTTTPPAAKPAEEPGLLDQYKQHLANNIGGMVRGVGSIGATLLWPIDKATDMVKGDREQTIAGLVAGKPKPLSRNEERRRDIDGALRDLVGADPDSLTYKSSKLTAEVVGTAPIGGVVGRGVAALAPGAAPLGTAIATGGMRTGLPVASTLVGRAADLGLRSAGGAVNGAVTAGLVDPNDVGAGAGIGAAMPAGMKILGRAGNAMGRMVRGPAPSDAVLEQIARARETGYVLPPTQAKPTLANRALEGLAGKLTTAQAASARNQSVTNDLAKKAIGARELSAEGLAEVRKQANRAYDDLAKMGGFVADADFHKALDQAAESSAAMREYFPELANTEVDALVAGLKSRSEFGAQATIEAIKKFRADARTLKRADDPTKVALGRAHNQVANALEDLIDRNLQAAGAPEVLAHYRTARQTLAKVYDVEKALNAATGNINARKLAQEKAKGRPLSGELGRIADFAATFPKAAQSVDSMGSLPGVSPLDWVGAGTLSAGTANPAMLATVLARPMARNLALSGPVQSRLAQSAGPGLVERLLAEQQAQQLMYRGAPMVVMD